MEMAKLLRRVAYVVGGLIGFLLLIIIFLALVKIPIDLTGRKGMVESVASRSLDRRVKVDGNIVVTTSLWPIFQMEGLRISNPEGFQPGDLAQMKSARIQVSVLPLLGGKIHIQEFAVKALSVNLLANEHGKGNWSSHRREKHEKSDAEIPTKKNGEPQEGKMELTSDSFVLKKLSFEDISVSYQNASMNEPTEFKIDQCTGAALVGKPFTLAMRGTLLNEPFTTTVEAGSIQELLEESKSWMKFKTEISNTHFELAGNVDLSQVLLSLDLRALVQGERLDSLNRLLQLDLPPLKSYGADALLSWRKGRLDLSDLEVRVGKSKLIGKGAIETTGQRPKANIKLTAPLIQLDDFNLGDWSPEDKEEKAAKKEEESVEASKGADEETYPDKKLANLSSPEVLGKVDATLEVIAEKVMSGADQLGGGLLTATLEQGRFSLDPIKLNLPGGSLFFALSVKPGREASEASVKAIVENFDFGVLARRAKPDTDMGGTINLDVDLRSSARKLGDLLANASGHFDFSGHPVNLRAGILDLWAVNLIAAIASKGDEEGSKINCIVGRWSMKDGLLRPETFVIDSSKIRICGVGYANFKKELLDLTVAPTAKKGEYFSLATPIGVKGNFDDFKLGITSGGLLTTVVSFTTSPLHASLRRIVNDKLPENGEDVCGMAIGSHDRPTELPRGCRHLKKK